MKINRTLVIATAGAALTVLGSGQAAMAATVTASSGHAGSSGSACSPSALVYVQSRVDLAVAHRELTITQLTATLAQRGHVSDPHRAALQALFTSDASGLQAVNATVHADTTCKQAVTDGRAVVSGFRVYMLLSPQAHLVMASDTGTFAAGRLAAAEPKLQAGIDAITDLTKRAQAQAAFNDLVAQTTTATDDFAGVADTVLALKPADMPAGQTALAAEHAKVTSGRAALAAALSDAKTIGSLLV